MKSGLINACPDQGAEDEEAEPEEEAAQGEKGRAALRRLWADYPRSAHCYAAARALFEQKCGGPQAAAHGRRMRSAV